MAFSHKHPPNSGPPQPWWPTEYPIDDRIKDLEDVYGVNNLEDSPEDQGWAKRYHNSSYRTAEFTDGNGVFNEPGQFGFPFDLNEDDEKPNIHNDDFHSLDNPRVGAYGHDNPLQFNPTPLNPKSIRWGRGIITPDYEEMYTWPEDDGIEHADMEDALGLGDCHRFGISPSGGTTVQVLADGRYTPQSGVEDSDDVDREEYDEIMSHILAHDKRLFDYDHPPTKKHAWIDDPLPKFKEGDRVIDFRGNSGTVHKIYPSQRPGKSHTVAVIYDSDQESPGVNMHPYYEEVFDHEDPQKRSDNFSVDDWESKFHRSRRKLSDIESPLSVEGVGGEILPQEATKQPLGLQTPAQNVDVESAPPVPPGIYPDIDADNSGTKTKDMISPIPRWTWYNDSPVENGMTASVLPERVEGNVYPHLLEDSIEYPFALYDPDTRYVHAYIKEAMPIKHNQLIEMAKGLPEDQSEILHQFDDGSTLRAVTRPSDLTREGELMRNCIGDGGYDYIISLRDKDNIPHVSIDPQWGSAYGRGNSDIPKKYLPLLRSAPWKDIEPRVLGNEDIFPPIKYRNADGQLHRTDGPAIEYANGRKEWYQNGQLHRTDGPAIEYANGRKEWYQNDQLHRTDGPAIEHAENGTKEWYQNDQLHRTDGPAIEHTDGTKEWWLKGKLHRTDGPAIEYPNGYRAWYQNDKRHRIDGPAVEHVNGTKEWYQNGQLHRTDGPAIKFADGTEEWWLNGRNQRRGAAHLGSSIKEAMPIKHNQLIEMAKGLPEDQSKILHQFDDGSTLRAVTRPSDLTREGELMRNCIGDGGYDYIISLRDKDNIPHVSIDPQWGSAYGRGNSDIPKKYLPLLQSAPWKEIEPRVLGNEAIFPRIKYRNADGQLHRVDGPAIELPDGHKEWYQNGQLHRTDGPAIEYANGRKEWYQNNQLHRIDGPAVERPDGNRQWYQNGQRHRTDGPAIERPDGTKAWYQNGQRHRTDGPAIELPDGHKEWYQNGQRHRTDGPAIEHANGRKDWYQNDQLHRIDGPAIERPDGTKEWYQNNQLHRTDGPAIERPDGNRQWYLNSQRHRIDGPAVERPDGTKEWYQNGQLHRIDGPAIEHADGTKMWYQNGQRHRIDGPAVERSDGYRAWYLNSQRHRTDGPAVEYANGERQWYQDGRLHRENGPAIEYVSGTKEWYQNGQLHRVDGPAIEYPDGYRQWYQNGQRHRTDGPVLGSSIKEAMPIKHNQLIEMAKGLPEDQSKILHQFDDGSTLRKLTRPSDFTREGELMRNCIGGGGYDYIISLRDKDNIPHVSIDPEGGSVYGRGNSEIPKKYLPLLRSAPWQEIEPRVLGNEDIFPPIKYRNADGQLHRVDGPAIKFADGHKEWWLNDKRHRTDGPAIEHADGTKEWYQNGQRHRTDGPAVERSDGTKMWYQNSQRHRIDGPAIEHVNGTKEWYQNGQRHRTDGPAIELPDGHKEWYQDGKRHRTDGPAVEYANGTKQWWLNGQLHRVDGPAIERPDGTEAWYQNNQLHRTDGPAIEHADGTKEWYQNGQLHRTDGPAIEHANGTKMWYQNGQLHRTEGPAVEHPDGTEEWWLNGKRTASRNAARIEYDKDAPNQIPEGHEWDVQIPNYRIMTDRPNTILIEPMLTEKEDSANEQHSGGWEHGLAVHNSEGTVHQISPYDYQDLEMDEPLPWHQRRQASTFKISPLENTLRFLSRHQRQTYQDGGMGAAMYLESNGGEPIDIMGDIEPKKHHTLDDIDSDMEYYGQDNI